MKVKELIQILEEMNKEANVNLEVKVNGVEFCADLSEVYSSENVYLFADFGKATNFEIIQK